MEEEKKQKEKEEKEKEEREKKAKESFSDSTDQWEKDKAQMGLDDQGNEKVVGSQEKKSDDDTKDLADQPKANAKDGKAKAKAADS